MTTITRQARVDAEGNVVVPVGRTEAGQNVIVTVEPAPPSMTQAEWQEFINRTAGSIPDLERPPQGEYEKREPLE